MNTARGLPKLVEIGEEVDFHDDAQFSPDSVHRVVDRKPATDHGAVITHQQRVQVDVHFPDGVMRTVRVMVQDSTSMAAQLPRNSESRPR